MNKRILFEDLADGTLVYSECSAKPIWKIRNIDPITKKFNLEIIGRKLTCYADGLYDCIQGSPYDINYFTTKIKRGKISNWEEELK